MKRRTLLILCIFLIPLLSFAQKTEYAVTKDIQYYDKSEIKDQYMSERCVLDIYYPTNKENFATVVWFHGGGLTGGSKELPDALKNQDICIIGVNYRLYPQVKVEQCVEDAAAAVAWTFKNIEKYKGSKSLIFVSGHSAGGYLASMVGLDKSRLDKYDIEANDIAGLIPFSGQAITHFADRQDRGIPEYQPLIDNLAPLYYVRADAPPLLIITGDRELELLGRYEENAYLMRMMKVAGHKDVRLMELDGYGHNMAYPAFPLLLNEVRRVKDKKEAE